MYFHSFSDFFSMGGYGYYVWLAYAIVAIIFLSVWLQSSYRLNKALQQVKFTQSLHPRQDFHAAET